MSDLTHKSEKLASAIYLITSFWTDQEPLKWKLRSLASEFIQVSLSLKDDFFKEREVAISETKNLISKITKLLTLAKNAGLMSLENHDLMDRELVKYLNQLDNPLNISDFLNIEAPKPRIKEFSTNLMIRDKNEYKEPEREKSLKGFGAVTVKKNSRQSVIISILKRKKEIMIKDVAPLIAGCSEKTIQRELSEMVRTGVLKRMGEKRWSRYTLA